MLIAFNLLSDSAASIEIYDAQCLCRLANNLLHTFRPQSRRRRPFNVVNSFVVSGIIVVAQSGNN